MKRRELIRGMAAASVMAGTSGLILPSVARAACMPLAVPDMSRTVVNFMLSGGADMRFVFMPAPGTLDPAHEALIFSSRREMYDIWQSDPDPETNVSYSDLFHANFKIPVNEPTIGIHNSSGWLLQEFEANRVAVIANAVCSENRRHDQSIQNANSGKPGDDQLTSDIDGWGGRLVETIGSLANSVELGGAITVLSQGTTSGDRLAQAIHAANTRDIALPSDVIGSGSREVVTRALKAYYAGREPEVAGMPAKWPYQTYFKHNADFRSFGDVMSECMLVRGSLPDALLPGGLDDFNLFSNSFEQQCRNLYDVCLAPDVLGSRVVSMGYGGWDTHGDEEFRATRNWSDIFGTDGGLDRSMREIALIDSNAYNQLVIYFGSDFGRQLVVNGDLGTDHGRGIYSVMIGTDVQSGIYGDMFPPEEAVSNGSYIPLEHHGADITGKTSTEHLLAAMSEWAHPNSGATAEAVVPGHSLSKIETAGMLNGLLPTS